MTSERRIELQGSGRTRRTFGRTWWGMAWVEALEQRSRLDPNRLPRGRTYARQSRVTDLEAVPGAVTALVYGSRPTPYRVQVRVREFTAAEWALVLDAISSRAAHAAALLEGELTASVVEDVASTGLALLPGAGEIGTTCSCPDWANPCKHAAAVCYLTADLFDDDPFVALLLRGRTRDEVVAGLRARRSTPGGGSPAERVETGESVPARDAWSQPRPATDVPPPPPLRERPGRPAALLVDPPLASGLSGAELSELAADAGRRAWQLLAGEGDGGMSLDVEADLARRAAEAIGSDRFEAIAGRAGRSPRSLLGRAITWQHGGSAGLAVSDQSWRPSSSDLDTAREALRSAGVLVRIRDNRFTVLGTAVQLRLALDGRWYRFERRNGEWELTSAPAGDPVEALDSPV